MRSDVGKLTVYSRIAADGSLDSFCSNEAWGYTVKLNQADLETVRPFTIGVSDVKLLARPDLIHYLGESVVLGYQAQGLEYEGRPGMIGSGPEIGTSYRV
jgi:hypothetical protein